MFPGCYFSSLQGDPSPEVILRDLDPQSKILCGLEVKTSSSSTAQWATWKCSLLSETLEHSLNCIQSILPIIFFEKSWSTKWPEIYVTFPTISFYLGTKVQKWSSILYEHICVWRLAVHAKSPWKSHRIDFFRGGFPGKLNFRESALKSFPAAHCKLAWHCDDKFCTIKL